MSEEVTPFEQMFMGPPGKSQREALQERGRRERRTQLTPKQRKRGGVRTTQINYRCTPHHHELALGMARFLNCSVADAMEDALVLLAETKGYKAGV